MFKLSFNVSARIRCASLSVLRIITRGNELIGLKGLCDDEKDDFLGGVFLVSGWCYSPMGKDDDDGGVPVSFFCLLFLFYFYFILKFIIL